MPVILTFLNLKGPLFSNHSKTMMLKTKADIHVFSAVVKIFV